MPLPANNTTIVSSPAKLNISLRLLAPRPQDGFTELHSIVALIDWQDTLSFTRSEAVLSTGENSPEVAFTCSVPSLTANPEDNLVVKAVRLFYQQVPFSVLPSSCRPTQWVVALQKNIPSQAGLGGGSSNAASTLRFLRDWHQAKDAVTCYTLPALQQLGSQLGSDIPLFLAAETPAVVCMTGRGERVTTLPPLALNSLAGIVCVVVKPKAISVSTPLAFQALHRQQAYSQVYEMAQLAWLEGLMAGVPLQKLTPYLVNEFEPLVWHLEPALQPLTEKLKSLGAFHALLCGSGSAVVGLFEIGKEPHHEVLNALFPKADFDWMSVPFLS